MQNKLRVNKCYIPTKFLKIVYLQSRVADNTLVQLSTQLKKYAKRLFSTVNKMFNVLTVAFNNANQKQEAWAKYQGL